MRGLLGDARLGLRQLHKQPGHSAVVIVTLGLALGLSAVIFSFVSFFLLRPLPVRDEKTMVLVRGSHPQEMGSRTRLSYPDFLDFKAQATTIEELVGMRMATGALTGRGDPKRVAVEAASEALFRVWDLEVLEGRRFERSEDAAGAPPVVLLSHGFWEREFGRDPKVVGTTVTLDGEKSTVVGVLAPAIEIGNFADIDVWRPLAQMAPSEDRERRDMAVTGRRRPGVTIEQVGAEFATIATRLQKEHPTTNKDWTVRVLPLRDGLYGSGTDVILSLLVLGVCLVFAVACANVAGIMLARATAREREMALRLSLGASRRQILRQLLAEGIVLSALGAILGLVLAQLGLLLMRSVAFEQFYKVVIIDWRVLAFSAGLALVAPVLFGLAPALQAAGRELSGVLRDSGAGAGTSGRVGRSRRGLVVMQIGLASALLMVSGLSVRTAITLRNFDFGFDTADLLSVRIDLPELRYQTPEEIRNRADQLLSALSGLPQVKGAAIGTERPVFDSPRQMAFRRGGQPDAGSQITGVTMATPHYLRTIGVNLRQGRDLLETDGPEAPAVAVVNEALVARDFAGLAPLGQRVQVGGPDTPWLEIVGVAANIANPNLGQPPTPQAYVAFAQRPQRALMLLVRTSSPGSVLTSLREAMRSLDPDQPVYDAKTIQQVAWEDLASNRIITGLFMALGGVALALSATGLYGLTAFLVAHRSREIGVRMALGATARDVLTLVVSQGAKLTGAGLAAGLTLGIFMGRAMSSILFGVKPWDPLTLGVTLSTLGLAAILAHWVPARRAAMVNPIDALRHD